ncbi:MAG: hypothetical protein CVU64_11380 [Deltaproteobacteria bacterium HGW-Deltaproteobacteria-21]|jgi:hypothetical protein|nr:MAG: hypothetical protein CVU64_11380 [Deltaproteobacteria bacterium HGW-Deltaproteobacteria-21]
MSWKFWEKNESGANGPKLSGLKGIPNQVGRDLVVNKGENPDWVWSLKCVTRQKEGVADSYDFRVFDEEDAVRNSIAIRNYNSLDQSPQLILYEGWYNNKTNKAEVVKTTKPNQAMK